MIASWPHPSKEATQSLGMHGASTPYEGCYILATTKPPGPKVEHAAHVTYIQYDPLL